jgi:hypothetical protein
LKALPRKLLAENVASRFIIDWDKCFKSKVVLYFTALLSYTYLSTCTATGVKQAEPTQALATSPIAEASPQVRKSETDGYAKLNDRFLVKLKQVADPDLRMYYIQGIHYLHRLAQDNPQNREILEKLLQQQDKTLDIFQICGGKETFTKAFDWLTLDRSQFWKRADNSYLVLLVCSTSTTNRRFVPFLYSEANGKANFKPLSLTQFRRRDDGTIQQVEPEELFGGPFPNSNQWFDPTTEELFNWTRLGGGSDPCGTKGIYRLQNEEFVLQEFTARFECNPAKKGNYEKLYPQHK